MFQTDEKQIGGYKYRVTQLDALKGRRAFTRLMKVVGPAIGELASGKADDIAPALEKLVTRLSEDDVDHFCDLFARVTSVSGGDLKEGLSPQLDSIFAAHFSGRYLEMAQWLIFCFQVNFASFFAGAASLLGQAAPRARASTSPTASTGGSGDS